MPEIFFIPNLPNPNLLEDNLHPDFNYEQQEGWKPAQSGSEYDLYRDDYESQLDCLHGSEFCSTLNDLRLVTDLPGAGAECYQMPHATKRAQFAYDPQQPAFYRDGLTPNWLRDHLSTDQDSCSNASAWSPRGADSQTDYENMSNGCAPWYAQPGAQSPGVPLTKPSGGNSTYMFDQSMTNTPVHIFGANHDLHRPEQTWGIDPSQLSPFERQSHDLAREQLPPGAQAVLPSQPYHPPALQSAISEPNMVPEDTETAMNDQDSDYKPSSKQSKTRRQSAPALGAMASVKRKTEAFRVKGSRIVKRPCKRTSKAKGAMTNGKSKEHCKECDERFASASALHKHILNSHRRPFTCTFRRYGCTSTFGSKNEWKRHVSSQHLRPGVYRCDMGTCVPQSRYHRRKGSSTLASHDEPSYNEFNRKDLFTQHVRRMHGPNKTASKDTKQVFEDKLEGIRQRCWRPLHDSPPCSTCGFCPPDPKTKQHVVFSGPGSWDERMEHVGKHLEKCEKDIAEEEDVVLREWLVNDGLLDQTHGGWTIVGAGGGRKVELGDDDADGEYE